MNICSNNDCKDWKEGIEAITRQQMFCLNQSAAPKWNDKVFKYCPWCGYEVEELKE